MAHILTTVPSLGSNTMHIIDTNGMQYSWSDEADCSSDKMSVPVQADWEWLSKSTTVDGGSVPCPTMPGKKCRFFSGPWPEQITSIVKLWLLSDSSADDSGFVPTSLEMTCGLFPFTIFKNYSAVEFKAPPASAFALDKSCANTTRSTAGDVELPRTREEALATGRLGPYTGLLRRMMGKA